MLFFHLLIGWILAQFTTLLRFFQGRKYVGIGETKDQMFIFLIRNLGGIN